MQPPPPPACCTGTAPPGAGGAGVTTDGVAVAGGAPPDEWAAARATAVRHAHSAARVLAFGVPTRHNSSCWSVDAQVTTANYEHTPRILQGVGRRVTSPQVGIGSDAGGLQLSSAPTPQRLTKDFRE